MATSGSKSIAVTSWDTLKFSWSRSSYSVENNTSTIAWKMELIATGSGRIDSSTSKKWSVTVNGIEYSGTNKVAISTNSTITLASGSTTIAHNSDGSKSFSYSFSQQFAINFGGKTIGTISGSDTGVLDNIPRAATITSAPNFNDEANPTISYSNPAGNAVTKLEACISLDGSKDDIAYRDISKTGSSYTFNLTTAERNVLRNAAKNKNSITVRFYVATTIGDSIYRKYVAKTLTIVNATPTLAPTAIDNGSVSKTLTGDASGTVIRGYNSMNVAANATALKGASITSYKITCGGKSISTASGVLSSVDSGTFTFTVTDSRGNTATKTLTKKFIDYVKLTCNLIVNPPTTGGDMSFTVKGNYFAGSFGAVANTLTVQYRYKTNDGGYGSWTTLTPTISGNTYTATGNLTGLDYQNSYTFQARAIDKIYNGDTEPVAETPERRVKTTPIFDWDADSFAFHVPLFLDNTKQIWHKDTSGNDVLMVSLNTLNQAFFGYGTYNAEIGTTYFDGNAVNIRSKNNITCSATGTIGGNKAWTSSSDERLKANIETIPDVFIDIWLELEPKVFEWNNLNSPDGKKHFGLIAQEAIEVFNKYGVNYKDFGFIEVVPVDEVEYLAITYEYYNMLTAQVLKKTANRLSALESTVAELKQLMGVN